MPSQHDSISTHLAKFVSSTSFHNSPQIFVMSRDLPMQQRTLSHVWSHWSLSFYWICIPPYMYRPLHKVARSNPHTRCYSRHGGQSIYSDMDFPVWNTIYCHLRPWQAIPGTSLSELLGVSHLRTTSYHPISNGLVEHFHRQLKASLKASPLPDHWTDMLPLALLGIRTSYKEDLLCMTAELVYDTSLHIPGEFFTFHDGAGTDPASYITHLKDAMRALRCTPPRQPSQVRGQIDSSISTASHVFVCHDTVKQPLQYPYDDPYQVLARYDKFYTLDLNSRKDTVFVDQLKPAHLDQLPTDNTYSSSTDLTSSPPQLRQEHLPLVPHDLDARCTGQLSLPNSFPSRSL